MINNVFDGGVGMESGGRPETSMEREGRERDERLEVDGEGMVGGAVSAMVVEG